MYQVTVWPDLPLALFSFTRSSVSCARLMSSFRMRSHLVLPALPAVPDVSVWPVCTGVRGVLVLPSYALGRDRRAAPSSLAGVLERLWLTDCRFALVFALVFAVDVALVFAFVFEFVELATMIYSSMEWLQNAVVQPWEGCGQGVARVW